VRQRLTTPYPWTAAAQPAIPPTDESPGQPERPAFTVEPGDVIDLPSLLDGFTPADDGPELAGDETPKTSAKKRTAAPPADSKEGDGGESK
jgi:hypothetical protein